MWQEQSLPVRVYNPCARWPSSTCLASSQKSAYSRSLLPLKWVSFDTCLLCAGAAHPALTWHFESTRPLFSLMYKIYYHIQNILPHTKYITTYKIANVALRIHWPSLQPQARRLGAKSPLVGLLCPNSRSLLTRVWFRQNAEERAREQNLMKGAGGAMTANYLSDSGSRGGISDDHLPWMILVCYKILCMW
jgi:hypothetical protein